MTPAEKREQQEIERKIREGQRRYNLQHLTEERDKLARHLHETKNDELRKVHATDRIHMVLTILAGHLSDLEDQEMAAMVVEIREYFSFCGYSQDNGLRYEQEYLAQKEGARNDNDG